VRAESLESSQNSSSERGQVRAKKSTFVVSQLNRHESLRTVDGEKGKFIKVKGRKLTQLKENSINFLKIAKNKN
jgi:hypothetical protein